MGDWHPIITAPKDGTRFIAYGLWTPTWKEPEPRVAVVWRYDDEAFSEELGAEATHWMPLPEAPQ